MATVIHRIEGRGYTDLLLKGEPTRDEADKLADGREWILHRSLWPERYLLRIIGAEHREAV